MKKNAAILGALLLGAAAIPAFAQSSGMTTDEGRPHTSNAPTRELTKMCKAEAKDKKLTGKERSTFLRDCQTNKVAPEGSTGASSSSAKTQASPGASMKDADGRTQGDVTTSKTSKKPVTSPNATGAGTNTDADGKARAK
jgi:hypothetical protein